MIRKKLDVVFLIISLIAGAVLWVGLEFLYRVNFSSTNRVFSILLYIAVFAIVMGLIILIKSKASDAYKDSSVVLKFTAIALVLLLAVTPLFEFLYELGDGIPDNNGVPSLQYVFLIDDSGSMDGEYGNDPTGYRYEAVQEIIKQMSADNQFAVYHFGMDVKCATQMGSVVPSEYSRNSVDVDGSETNLRKAIQVSLDEVANPEKAHTKIIVLTDGFPYDMRWGGQNKAIKLCLKKNASISSVGFGQPNEELMNELAEKTGGVYVFSDNIDNLLTSLQQVMSANVENIDKNRDLLGHRFDMTAGSALYAILRILFLALLGVLWTVAKMALVGDRHFSWKMTIISGVACALAAILVECMTAAGFADIIARFVFCVLWAMTPIEILEYVDLGGGATTYTSSYGMEGFGQAKDYGTQMRGGQGTKSI